MVVEAVAGVGMTLMRSGGDGGQDQSGHGEHRGDGKARLISRFPSLGV